MPVMDDGNFVVPWFRRCANPKRNPRCKEVMVYATKKDRDTVERRGGVCTSCGRFGVSNKRKNPKTHSRLCPNPDGNPNCRQLITYVTEERMRYAEQQQKKCASCRRPGWKPTLQARLLVSEKLKARFADVTNHPMFGKQHTKETKEKIGAKNRGRIPTAETRKKISLAGMGRDFTGRPKPTPEAIRKMLESRKGFKHSPESIAKMKVSRNEPALRKRLSEAASGCNNPMYGRRGPSAPGYGRKWTDEQKKRLSEARKGRGVTNIAGSLGIGGWYKGQHFRSSCELNFLLTNQEDVWVSAESDSFAIPYTDAKGRSRYYYADWYSNGVLVEIKPMKWQSNAILSVNVVEKVDAAEAYCKAKGWEYRLVELSIIPKRKIFAMREAGVVVLDSKWEREYQKTKEIIYA